MKIKFTLTKNHLKRYYWYCLRYRPISEFVSSFIIPLFLGCLVFVNGLNTGASYALVQGVMTVVSLVSLQLILLPIVVTYRFWRAFKPASIGERTIEIGKFDLCWGSPQSAEYYFHWSNFEEIVSTRTMIYFRMKANRALIVPKSAFADAIEYASFLQQARERWETAKANERHAATLEAGAWPPPPRIGA